MLECWVINVKIRVLLGNTDWSELLRRALFTTYYSKKTNKL